MGPVRTVKTYLRRLASGRGRGDSSRLQLADNERSEFVAQVRGNTSFKSGVATPIISFDDLRNFMKTSDDAGSFMRHLQLDELAQRPDLTAEFGQQGADAFASCGRDSNGIGMFFGKASHSVAVAIQLIGLIQHHESGFSVGADFFEDIIDGFDLLLGAGMARIDNMEEEVSLDDFFEGGLESFNQAMRQLANKTDGIGKQDILVRGQPQTTGGGVERGEKLVFGEHTGTRESIEQGGFARVRITDD